MKKKLGEILVAARAVTQADIELALMDQSAGEPARLGDLLVSLGKISPLQLAQALCEQYGLPFTEVPPVPSAVLEAVPLDVQRQFRFVPIDVQPGAITIAMADPSVAIREVLPVLKRRYSQVKIFVAAGDEVDSVHATLSGDYGPPSLQLPHVAPVIAPVHNRPSPSPTADELFGSLDLDAPPSFELDPPATGQAKPSAPDEEEPFFFEATVAPPPPVAPTIAPVVRPVVMPVAPPPVSSSPSFPDLSIEEPVSELQAWAPPPIAPPPVSSSPSFPDLSIEELPPPVSSSPSFPELTIEEEPQSASLPELVIEEPVISELGDGELTEVPSTELPMFELPDSMPEFAADAPPPMTEVPWDAAAAIAAEPVAPEALAETAAFFDSQFLSTPSAEVEISELPPAEPEAPVEVSLDEDSPFFDAPGAGPSVRVIEDEDFVSGVPASSPSSLARLQIEPEAPLVPVVPPVTLPVDLAALEEPRPSSELPDWLSGAAPRASSEHEAWSPELERLGPSKLIVAVTKALLKRGLVSQADILEALEPRK